MHSKRPKFLFKNPMTSPVGIGNVATQICFKFEEPLTPDNPPKKSTHSKSDKNSCGVAGGDAKVSKPASSLELAHEAPPTSGSDGHQLEDSASDSDGTRTSGSASPISVDVFQAADLPSSGDPSDDDWSSTIDPHDHDDLFFESNGESTTDEQLHAEVVLESHRLEVDQRTASVFRRMGERINAMDSASLSDTPMSTREVRKTAAALRYERARLEDLFKQMP
ncbi:hypothetical protein DFH06DRAFT_146669 [Mycena polygramma]|nr:hypothetical protein DFH06DRAFT_146669 [Mycena polygramma]